MVKALNCFQQACGVHTDLCGQGLQRRRLSHPIGCRLPRRRASDGILLPISVIKHHVRGQVDEAVFCPVEMVKGVHHLLEPGLIAKTFTLLVDGDRSGVRHAMQTNREKLIVSGGNGTTDQ